MAQAERKPETASDALQIGAKHLASLMEMQRELLDTLEQIQRDRLARTMDETKLASELVAKMTGARSIPEIMAIYQEWIAKHAQMFAEDGRKFMEDSQRIANTTVRLLSGGGGGGAGT